MIKIEITVHDQDNTEIDEALIQAQQSLYNNIESNDKTASLGMSGVMEDANGDVTGYWRVVEA